MQKQVVEAIKEPAGILEGMTRLRIRGRKLKMKDALYSEEPPQSEETIITAVPYLAWGNREAGQMRVWIDT